MNATIPASSMGNPETLVGFFGMFLIVGFGIAALVRWISTGPRRPDPWETEGQEIQPAPEAEIVCHRCLLTNPESADFCANCGAPIGAYTNYLPFVNLFSMGYMFRVGASGEFRHTKPNIIGFVVMSLAQYGPFAPFYLYRLFKGVTKPQPHPGSVQQ